MVPLAVWSVFPSNQQSLGRKKSRLFQGVPRKRREIVRGMREECSGGSDGCELRRHPFAQET